jgi:hypothetical protein
LIEDNFDTAFAEGGFRSEDPSKDRKIAKRLRNWIRDKFEIELAK